MSKKNKLDEFFKDTIHPEDFKNAVSRYIAATSIKIVDSEATVNKAWITEGVYFLQEFLDNIENHETVKQE